MPPSSPKRKIQKRKRRLALGSDDEIVEEPTSVSVVAIENPVPADADVVDEEISTAEDVDNIIEQVISETAQLETEEEVTDASRPDVGDQEESRADEMEHWFNLSYKEFVSSDTNRRVETAIDTDGEPETVVCETVVQEKTVQTVAAETESRIDVSAMYVVTEPEDGTEKKTDDE
ncbi:midasin [Dorcoceras hygrometricum]|uniref:Midasin n=1 Tax=Dorcoceras hygrometricum TaxID=472368 RepID=A0A2Z7CS03_9LAMI|nr:midasin [Dorcoceras hygrometricum]